MNKLDQLFNIKRKDLLNIFCTAGYPHRNSLPEVILALQQYGADIVEVGMPYSDPVADGPVIQQSNMLALQNGMNIKLLLDQLNEIKEQVHIPVILMGYLNPVLQFGMEKFCEDAHKAGVDAVILPDMPMHEFEVSYQKIFRKYQLHVIFLITPETGRERVRKADKLSNGFLYAVSSSATTGAVVSSSKEKYYKKLASLKLRNPVLIGFGIKDNQDFTMACNHVSGAIIGSAYIKALENSTDIGADTESFINYIRGR